MTDSSNSKPLGRKAYGSIGHLPQSRMGPADHSIHEGQGDILTKRVRNRHDRIIVQEKLDGSNVGVALINGEVHALGRSGWLAHTSPYEQHWIFSDWVRDNEQRFRSVLRESEWISGEWLAQAHGTVYDLSGREPFVAFDLWSKPDPQQAHARLRYEDFLLRNDGLFATPETIHNDFAALSVEEALSELGEYGFYGAAELIEGAVWRCESKRGVEFLAKYVRPDKQDGKYLPEITNKPAVWNWRPKTSGED